MKDIMIAAELETKETASKATPAFEVDPVKVSSIASSSSSTKGFICSGRFAVKVLSSKNSPAKSVNNSFLKNLIVKVSFFSKLMSSGFSKINSNSIVLSNLVEVKVNSGFPEIVT